MNVNVGEYNPHEYYSWLVVLTILKHMKVSWEYDIPNIWETKTCSKPPTSYKYNEPQLLDL